MTTNAIIYQSANMRARIAQGPTGTWFVRQRFHHGMSAWYWSQWTPLNYVPTLETGWVRVGEKKIKFPA